MNALRIIDYVLLAALLLLTLSGCAKSADIPAASPTPSILDAVIEEDEKDPVEQNKEQQKPAPTLLYMGQASIRIVTPEDKVIYIDPYAGDAYDLPADLILLTHDHFDHCAVDRIENRNEDCRIITQAEALENGEHRSFVLPYVTVQAVEAGYNRWHDVRSCVGYVLTFSNGARVYISGDTSTTTQMAEMRDMEIDYAFFCCDGVYNMDLEEAARCAELVGAKHNIPYHNSTSSSGEMFDRELAEQWDVPNRLIVYPREEITLEGETV